MGAGAIPLTVKKPVKELTRQKKNLLVFLADPEYTGEGAVDVSFQSGSFFLAPPRHLLLDYRLGRCSAAAFEKEYIAFLEQSFVENKHNWEVLLESNKLVLICSCPADDMTCHRHVLIKFLKRFGALYKGILRGTKNLQR